ncbi:hypothetical protein V8G54_037373, partial [Vigna mungo]
VFSENDKSKNEDIASDRTFNKDISIIPALLTEKLFRCMTLGNQTRKKEKKIIKNLISHLKMNKPRRKVSHLRFPLSMTDLIISYQLIQKRMPPPSILSTLFKLNLCLSILFN